MDIKDGLEEMASVSQMVNEMKEGGVYISVTEYLNETGLNWEAVGSSDIQFGFIEFYEEVDGTSKNDALKKLYHKWKGFKR